MTDTPTSIQGVAQLASEVNGGFGGRAIERLAEAHGLVMSRTTFDRMRRGDYRGSPDAETISALAYLSQLSESAIRQIVALPEPLKPLADDLPPDADTLTPEQRAAVLAVVRQFANANRALERHEREQPHGSQAQGTPNRRAAGSAATHDDDVDAPAPPTENDCGLAAKRAPRERAFDDQSNSSGRC